MAAKLPVGAALVGVALVAVTATTVSSMTTKDGYVSDSFDQRTGLITNEYAFHHPDEKEAHESDRWWVTSGSLFARDGSGYSGVPDRKSVDPKSSQGNNSAAFRMISRNDGYEDTEVRLRFTPLAWAPGGASNDWSGFHVFARYKSETQLYVASAMRSSKTVAIKKKTSGGPSNDGTYQTLAEAPLVVHMDKTHDVVLRVTGADHVTLALEVNGVVVLNATDSTNAINSGRIGVRADDLEFSIDSIVARPVDPATLPRDRVSSALGN